MENKHIKILVAHPGRQHSYRVATALIHHDMLDKYATTVYDKKSSILMKITKAFIKGDERNRANRRRCPDVDDSYVIQFNEFTGLIELLIGRLDHTKKIALWFRHKVVSDTFQKKLARYIIKNDVKAVISYDTNSTILFSILKKKAPDVIRIIDNAHPCRNYLYEVYNEKLESSKQFAKTYEACGYLTDKEFAGMFGDEAKLADYHIVASTFSKQASLFNGIPEDKILLVPYGVSRSAFKPLNKVYDKGLKVLFVGEVNQRKGICQILDAAKSLHDYDIEFNIIGAGREYCSELYTPYEKYVNFRGRVPFEDLQMYYGTSHIFVFPSMGEGYGLVLPEALASGLPVIASQNCAGPDLIKNGYNGFIIDAGETQQLVDKILWFYNNMEQLPQMQENAIESVSDLTWEKYEETLIQQLEKKIFNKKSAE